MFMQGGGGVLANGWDCLGIKTYKVNIHPASFRGSMWLSITYLFKPAFINMSIRSFQYVNDRFFSPPDRDIWIIVIP